MKTIDRARELLNELELREQKSISELNGFILEAHSVRSPNALITERAGD